MTDLSEKDKERIAQYSKLNTNQLLAFILVRLEEIADAQKELGIRVEEIAKKTEKGVTIKGMVQVANKLDRNLKPESLTVTMK
jgi:hypothetical protein